MPGMDDDLPDYLRGVEQVPQFDEGDDYTLRPDRPGPISNRGFSSFEPDDIDDDLTEERRPPIEVRLLVLAGLGVALALVVLLLLGALTAAGATYIRDAEKATVQSANKLIKVVKAERKIVAELGARGGNRAELQELLAEVDRSDGGIDGGLKALTYTYAVQNQIVAIGDLRNTPIYRRQQRLDVAQDAFENDLGSWESSASSPLGWLALTLGLANEPPPRPR